MTTNFETLSYRCINIVKLTLISKLIDLIQIITIKTQAQHASSRNMILINNIVPYTSAFGTTYDGAAVDGA